MGGHYYRHVLVKDKPLEKLDYMVAGARIKLRRGFVGKDYLRLMRQRARYSHPLLLAAGSYLHLEMWLVALCSAGSLFVCSAGYALVRRRKPRALLGCLKRAPYQLVPFMLSMFVMIVVLGQKGVTSALGEFLGTEASVPKYGVASFFASNLINNIPMSVLFASVIGEAGAGLPAVFATVIGSNLGAFFTPVGALAGLMFGSILRGHGLKFGYKEFLKLGVTVALPTLAAALGVLWLVV